MTKNLNTLTAARYESYKYRWMIGLALSLAFLIQPAQGQISDGQVAALVEALRLAAPQTGRADDGLYSEWQIKPQNIARWSKRCTGDELTPQLFESNPQTAWQILMCVMRNVFKEQYAASGGDESLAVLRSAAWWMTGDPEQYDSPSASSYTQKVLAFYQQHKLSVSRIGRK